MDSPPPSTLAAVLRELHALLRDHGEKQWMEWVQTDLRYLEKGDGYGAEHFLRAFGGMGSLSDLIICPENGHSIAATQVDLVNSRLQSLRSRAYELARAFS